MKSKVKSISEGFQDVLGNYFSENDVKVFFKKLNNLSPVIEQPEILERKSFTAYNAANSPKFRFEVDQAITYSERKLSLDKFLDFLGNIGALSIAHGEVALSTDIANKMLSITKTDDRFINITAYIFYNFAEIYSRQAMWKESQAHIKKAISFFEKQGDIAGLAKSENLFGAIYAGRGYTKSAKLHFQKALSIVDQIKDKSIVALIENNLGIVSNIEGAYDEAYSFFRRALMYFEGLQDHKHIAEIRHNLGMVFTQKKEYDSALKEFDLSINVSIIARYFPTLAISYVGKALIYCEISDFALANAFADKGMEVSYKINDKLTIADIYKIKGIIERKNKHFDSSENFFFSSLRLNKEFDNEMNYAETAVELAVLYKESKQIEDAAKYFTKALAFYSKIKAQPEIDKIKRLMG
jgi:tetratricopeptide (TPR) repeat protein